MSCFNTIDSFTNEMLAKAIHGSSKIKEKYSILVKPLNEYKVSKTYGNYDKYEKIIEEIESNK